MNKDKDTRKVVKLDPGLHREIKVKAVSSDVTISEWVTQACVAALGQQPKQRRRERLSAED